MGETAPTPDILPRLRSGGLCGDPCKVMDARSGCVCAEAADEIERLELLLKWARPRLKSYTYRAALDRYLVEMTDPDHTEIVQS